MATEKRSISAPAELFARADAKIAAMDEPYADFSKYVQFLIKQDVKSHAPHVQVRKLRKAKASRVVHAALTASGGPESHK